MKTKPLTLLFAIAVGLAVTGACKIGRCDIIYAIDSGNDKIEKFTPDGVGSVFATGPYGGALAVDSVGNIYTVGGSTVFKFNPNGTRSLFANTSPYEVEGMAFDGANNLYVSLYNVTTYAFKKFTPSGVGTTFANISNSPGAVATDPFGNIYLALVSGGITKYTPNGIGSPLPGFNSSFGGISDVTCDSAGNLYATVYNGKFGDTIVKITPDGVSSTFRNDFAGADPGNAQTGGIAIDSTGNLYVNINNYGVIDKITPDGVSSVFANFNGSLAVSPVPEPTAFALASCGAAIVALAVVKQRVCRTKLQ